MNMQSLVELCEAFNAHDPDRIMARFSDECVLEMPAEWSDLLRRGFGRI